MSKRDDENRPFGRRTLPLPLVDRVRTRSLRDDWPHSCNTVQSIPRRNTRSRQLSAAATWRWRTRYRSESCSH